MSYFDIDQEEGWVVCRAFQKPIPNQRPFFPTYATPTPGYYDHLPNARLHVDGDHHIFLGSALHPGPAAGGNSFPQLFADDLESKKHLFSIPQLESPTADCYIAQRSSNPDHQLIQGGQAAQAAGAIDWNFLDTLLSSATATSQLHEPSTSLL